jgi:D-alanine-D-alanine ligase
MDRQRLISREVVTHMEKGVIADQFYAERLYTVESIGDLLKTAGFSDIAVHGEISPDSRRNQDLGMMGKRIISTAIVRKEWTPLAREEDGAKDVVVVLGDPAKPDTLKPLCVFDEDDFHTIDRMKSPLRELNCSGAGTATLRRWQVLREYRTTRCSNPF